MRLIRALLATTLAQEPAAAAKELLDSVVEKLKGSDTIAFEVEQSLGPHSQGKTQCFLRRPDKARFDGGGQRVLFDGTTQWTTFERGKTYSKNPVRGVPPYKGYGPIYDLFFRRNSERCLSEDRGPVSVQKEKLGKAEFDVVTWKTEAGDTRLWIGKDKLIFRYDETWLADGKPLLVTVAFSAWNLQPKLADGFFSFTPPKDAKEE